MTIASFLARGDTSANESVYIGGRLEGHALLVPMLSSNRSATVDQIRIGQTIARASGGDITVVDPTAADDDPLVTFDDDDDPVEWITDYLETGTPVPDGVFHARGAESRIRELIEGRRFDTLVLPKSSDMGLHLRRRVRKLGENAPCNVIAVNGDTGYRSFASILLPIATGPHSGLATDVAGGIAAEIGAYVDILHVIPTEADADRRQQAVECTETAAERIDLPDRANTWILEGDDPAQAIIEQSSYYGMTVIGAPTAGRLHRFVYGSTSQSIRHGANSLVVAVRTPDVL